MNPLKALPAVALVAVGCLAALGVVRPGTASAQPSASETPVPQSRLRLAHLSPDTPPVDIYATGFDGVETKVLSSLDYREVSEYMRVPIGLYQFSMRPAGAPVTDPAMLSAAATLEGEGAYTFVTLGPLAEVQTQLVVDDLQAPEGGATFLRVIQAAPELGRVSVQFVDGPGLFSDLAFGEVARYTEVPAQRWRVRIVSEDPSKAPVESMVDLEAGSVMTLIVGGKNEDSLGVTTVVDATGLDLAGKGVETPLIMPAGGIATGGGALAGGGLDAAPSSPGMSTALLVAGLMGVVLLCGGAAVAVRAHTVRV